ncbi:uncharacterized protein G2W53_022451 [Senna tora]|uniref:Uncharacterized protein n=1 Tax=Senna tora TaxID=362788 RepID=A0A834TMB4_9FABA|nr:uncharacterized protein G2W53_022451 [Senna tora]
MANFRIPITENTAKTKEQQLPTNNDTKKCQKRMQRLPTSKPNVPGNDIPNNGSIGIVQASQFNFQNLSSGNQLIFGIERSITTKRHPAEYNTID